jgi:TRAP-type transport system periplasmic protein
VDGDLGQLLAAETASINLKVLSYFDGGFRSVANIKRPVLAMEDLRGLKVRVGESTLLINTQQALGSNPIPMSFGEIYTALQQGTIDGVDTSIIYVLDGNFQEVAKYVLKLTTLLCRWSHLSIKISITVCQPICRRQ